MGISAKMRIWIQSVITEGPLTSVSINLNFFQSLYDSFTISIFFIFFPFFCPNNIVTRTDMLLKVISGCFVEPPQSILYRRIPLDTFSSCRFNEFHSHQEASQLIRFYLFDQVFGEEIFQSTSIFSYDSICDHFLDLLL